MTYSIIQKSQLEGNLRLDAEYYQPEYLELSSTLESHSAVALSDLADDIICGPFGSALLQEDYREMGTPLLRVGNLNNWFVGDEKLAFIEDSLSQKLSRYHVFAGDLVVSQRGTIALFSEVTDAFPLWNISANLIAIKKSKKIDFNYLLAFLNSKYGERQLLRKLSGQIQPKITTDDVKQLLIFIPDNNKQKAIADYVRKALKRKGDSQNLYKQAETLLLEELGLADAKFEDELSYVVNFAEVEKVNRIDAEYFQPKYEKIMSKVKTQMSKLKDLVSIRKGFEPGSDAYQEEGTLFVRVSSLSKFEVEKNDQKYLSEEVYQKLRENFEPKIGEILLTKDATPGVAYALKEPVGGIVASGILRLKLKPEVEPEYLALVINSIVGQMQIERDTVGSVILHWRLNQVKNCLIPILPKSTQQKIADLVCQSHEARKKAKELLEKAKIEVENTIES